MADDWPAAGADKATGAIDVAGGTGGQASDVDWRALPLGIGDSIAVSFTQDALRFGRSLDIRRGSSVLFHLVVRPALGAVIANDRDGDAWGTDHSIEIGEDQVEDALHLHIAFEDQGALVQLADGRSMTFDRFRPDGTAVEFVVPPGIEVTLLAPSPALPEAAVPFDLAAWLGATAKDCSVAEFGSLTADPPGMLPLLALRQGASAITLVDVHPLVAPAWAPLQEVTKVASSLRKPAYLLHASWADPDLSDQLGIHDIVLCGSILPQVPDPLRLLLELRAMTRRHCFLSVPIVPDSIEGEHGAFDIGSIGAVFLPTATPDLLAQLQESAPGSVAGAEHWIDRGECNPEARWWAMTQRHVEGLVGLAGFRIARSTLNDAAPRQLDLLLDVT